MLLYKRQECKSRQKESMQHVSRSGEKGGPACGWWKVESTLLEQRKTYGL